MTHEEKAREIVENVVHPILFKAHDGWCCESIRMKEYVIPESKLILKAIASAIASAEKKGREEEHGCGVPAKEPERENPFSNPLSGCDCINSIKTSIHSCRR